MNKKSIPLIIAIVLIILFGFFTFYNSYRNLEKSIDEERVQYIGEIERQLVSRSNEIRDDISSNLHFLSVLLENDKPNSFVDAKLNYAKLNTKNQFQLILVSEKGICYNVDGSIFDLQNNELLSSLIIDKNYISSFERSSTGQNYLITAQPIKPFKIENENIVAIMFATTEELYRERMTLPLFDGFGMSFVCDSLGRLLISPQKDKYEIMGYNLFASLRELNVDDDTITNIEKDFYLGQSNYYYFQLDDRWLIQYESFNEGKEFIISLIPVSIVSNQLITDVSRTIQMAYITLFFLLLLIIIFVVIIYDIITQRNRTKFESEIREKEALNRSDFLSQMSHDMRTPLSAIVGMTQIAKENVDNKNVIEDSIEKVNSSANYMLDIINDILDLSKLESGKFSLNIEDFSLNQLIRKIELINQPKANEKNLYFNVSYNFDNELWYKGDKLRLSQILMNLISNAIKFTPEKGSVNVKIQTEEFDSKTDLITLIVKDTGIGMSQEFLKKIFTPYLQENLSISSVYGGSGLGLTIVDNLIKLMDGKIKVISEKGLGSEFIVKINLERVKNQITKTDDECSHLDFTKFKVLFIEDHPINRLIGEKQLQNLGIQVDSAENGKIGLDYFFKKPPKYYSFILTDIRMPIIDGYQVIKQIRKSDRVDKDIPIIIMSANAKDEKVNSEFDVNATLCKPVEVNELKEAICKIFIK
ncbi:MAG: ATP-binding protein [Pleomorphochaeta sp.]